MDSIERQHPLHFLTNVWDEKIAQSQRSKRAQFGEYADECMAFYTGDRDAWSKYMSGTKGVLYGESAEPDDEVPQHFRFVMAKSAELVQIYGPTLYHRNPVRTVTHRRLPEIPQQVVVDQQNLRAIQQFDQRMQQAQQAQQQGQQVPPPDPMEVMQYQQRQQMYQQQLARYDAIVQSQMAVEFKSDARGKLVETYLNFTPNELNLKQHSRRSINEALIMGVGFLITEVTRHHEDGHPLVGSFYLPCDRVLYDMDAQELDEPLWISIERQKPAWKLAEMFGADEEELKGAAKKKSAEQQAKDQSARKSGHKGCSNDLVTYYEVYSKMGAGDLLEGTPDKYRGTLSEFGNYVYLVIVPGIPYPLNLPSELLDRAIEGDEEAFQAAFEAVQWPIPFWLDGKDGWPISPLFFHWIPGQLWPMAHLRTSLPWLKFMNFAVSFAANSAQHTSRLLIGVAQGMEEEAKAEIRSGKPISIVETRDGKVSEQISAIQFPHGVTIDLQTVAAKAEEEFEKSSGLAEAMYASQGGIRSATEANLKQQAMNIRPDDMANMVEDWMSRVARKEALALTWLFTGQEVGPVLGPGGAALWDELFQDVDPGAIAMEFDYRVEAGSARKPNKASQIEQASQALQVVMPAAMQVGDINAANQILALWSKANDFQQVIQLNPPPPQPDPAEQAKAQAEQQKAQAAQQKIQGDIQAKQIEAQIRQQEAQMDLAMQREKHAIEIESMREQMAMEEAAASQELFQDQAVHEQEIRQKQEMGAVQAALAKTLGRAKVEVARSDSTKPRG